MRLAVIGAAGRTGRAVVRVALDRGHAVSAACRTPSRPRLEALAAELDARSEPAAPPPDGAGGRGPSPPPGPDPASRLAIHDGAVVSDPGLLRRTLVGCDAVIAILVSVRRLRATELVRALDEAMPAAGVRRAVFTAGETSARPNPGERRTLRQRAMLALLPPVVALTPWSLADMLRASGRLHAGMPGIPDWTIVRAPTLVDGPARGHRRCALAEVTGRDRLARADYADALLDAVEADEPARAAITVSSAR